MVIEGLGNRLLSALLLEDPGALFLGSDGEIARVTRGDGVEVALVGTPRRLDEVIKTHRSGLLHVVLFGGTADEGWRALKKRWPFWQLSRRRFAFHHVDLEGRYDRIKGRSLPALEQAELARIEPLTAEELERRVAGARAVLEVERDFVARSGAPWVTIAIGVMCAITFALQEWWGGSESIVGLVRMGANPGHPALRTPWVLLSSAFLHIGLAHLALNMLALFSFGPLLEKALGAPRYALLYVASALGGSLLSAAGHTLLVSAGASGALWGLMVGGAILITWPRGTLPDLLAARARRQVWQPVLLNGIYSFQPGVDWLCHLGGGIVGGALILSGVLLIGLRRDRAPAAGGGLKVAAAAAGALCVASLCVAWIFERPWELGAPPAMERQFTGFAGLSLEVPRGLKEDREPGVLSFGDLNRDPIIVEVRMGSSGENDYSPDQVVSERAVLFRELNDHPPPGSKLVGGVHDTTVAGAPGFRADLKMDSDLTARTYNWVVPAGVLVVRVYQRADLPPGWRSVPDSILNSLKTSGAKLD
jgi:rhomboid protease GluP